MSEDQFNDIEQKFEKLLIATNDADLIEAYANYKHALSKELIEQKKRIDMIFEVINQIPHK